MTRRIHCCWFSGEEKTRLARKCRASWVLFAPGWEIVEWDLAAAEAFGADVPPFFREAVRRRRWAFAADWLRFKALHEQGGVYFDYDLELVAPLEGVASGEWCAGQFTRTGGVGYEPGAGLALERGSPVARAMLEHYARADYDESLTAGERMAAVLGGERLARLPPEAMSPIDPDGRLHRTAATRGIHHYAMSWASPRRRLARWLNWHGCRAVVEALLRR